MAIVLSFRVELADVGDLNGMAGKGADSLLDVPRTQPLGVIPLLLFDIPPKCWNRFWA